ncbi:MAG TPA: aldehyde dehydrogenase family protein [Gemmatimonadales bacterium]|nr:aldehyde dehydrogenase family protein [Gemmatimonadales bacterium]
MSDSSRILIDGRWVAARATETRPVINPATLEPLGSAPECGAEDVEAAVLAAARAQPAWWKIPGVEKATLLHQIATKIRARGGELSRLMTRETGKPLVEAVDCIEWVAACFDYYAEVGRRSYGNSIPPVAPHQINFTVKEPYGVVAAIVPFNFPLLLMAWKVAPALAAGNALVCKPPHQNPLCNLLMAECYDALPPGVVNITTGGPATGELLVRHPKVDLIAFTGSVAAGRTIAELAGKALKKVNLELGSVDPFIVFADADLDVAVPGVAWARLLNAGQVCTSSKRIYLEAPIAQEFLRRLEAYVSTLTVGDPIHPETDIGPLISEEATQTVERQVAEAVRQGATLKAGGKRIAPPGLKGYFFTPTILSDVPHGSLPTTEEIFGPVLSLTVAKDADDAIAMANDSKFGLGASVYTRSLEIAMKAMEGVKAGTFWVNDPLTDNDGAPFGGMRWSGVGRELGEEGLDAFREPKHVHVDYLMEAKSYWYPYRERKLPEH